MIHNLLALALQQQPVARSPLPSLIMVVGMIAIFWFVLLRPQRKMRQEHEQMLGALKKGDEIMTDGGIIGQIVHLAEDRLTLRTAENTRVVVARQKIAKVFPAAGTTEPPKA